MVEKDKFLVVVSVLEGRNFPRRPKHELIVEARFDGELLATDVVGHGECPDFTQELAWELNKKGLHQHRLQRTSIKVQVYAVHIESSAREAVGYIVLDLRSASSAQSSKWHSLLHTKYSKTKPEIRLSLYIDNDKGPQQGSFRVTPPSQQNGDASLALTPRSLRPILNDAEGYYQLGPSAKCQDMFMVSVTVAFAANLPQLVPTSIPLPSTGFFFYYSLLGNDVTNETFRDLLNPTFTPERAAVRIRSSVAALEQFFNSQPGLEIHLCCGDQSLGCCDIPLRSLLKEGSTEIYMKPVTIEGAFELVPPARHRQQLKSTPGPNKPVVGVSIVLRKEDQAMSSTPVKQSPPAAQHVAHSTPPPQQKPSKQPPTSHPQPAPSHPGAAENGSYTETEEVGTATEDNVKSLGEEVREKARKAAAEATTAHEVTPGVSPVPTSPQLQPVTHTPPPPQTRPPKQPVTQQPADTAAHHYTVTLDMTSIKNQTSQPLNLSLRYSYMFFGSPEPVLIPPITAQPGTMAKLSHSLATFEFASPASQLTDVFNRVPLCVEVWVKQTDSGDDTMIGTAQILLAKVLSSKRNKTTNSSGMSGWNHSAHLTIPITSSQGKTIGELGVGLSLDDWGAVTILDNPHGQQNSPQTARQGPQRQGLQASPSQAPAAPVDPRQTEEYRAAMELELWKEQQTEAFQQQLKEKEAAYMRALADEWRRRHKDRELVLQKKMSEYQQLEDRLQKTVKDLDVRERQLSANEHEVLRLRGDLQREHDRKMTEMREASRRLQDDLTHQASRHKQRVAEQEEATARLKQQLSESESRYQQLAREFATYREQLNTKPEVRLQSEINLLTLEKVELERKVEAVTKSKVHYKQQWGRALKELARLKERAQTAAQQQLKKQQQELDHMRLRYLATEEQGLVQQERQQLNEIKAQLQELTDAEAVKVTQRSNEVDEVTGDDEHITRLIEERDSLLRTGVYTSQDPIIAELDRQIRDAISTRSR